MVRATPERREAILEVSARLFAGKGIATTTVRDIGEAAGVFSGSLYHYFASKDAIVGAILGRYMADIQERFAAVAAEDLAPEPTLRGFIRATLEIIAEHPHPTAMYQNDRPYLREHGLLEPVVTASRDVRAHWLVALAAGVDDGSFRKDVPVEIVYRSVRDTLWATTHWPPRAKRPPEEAADLFAVLFLDGLRLPG